jgi:hypothetical protein
MLCRKPFNKNGAQFGCGQCMHCRFNRRRIWTHRIILEALVHPKASFLTLTYNDDNLPKDGSLVPSDLQLYFKRLRKRVGGGIRYFAVGEYGDESWRPHYHAAIYGLDRLDGPVMDECWNKGFTYSGDLTFESAGYIAGYINKKMTAVDDERLQGRLPEFARMSLKPGIGAVSVQAVSDALDNKHGWDEIAKQGDVPDILRHGRRSMPLGRYLRNKLRDSWGVVPDNKIATFKKSAEMLNMYKDYLLDPKNEGIPFAVSEARKEEQKRLNIETRANIYKKRSKI